MKQRIITCASNIQNNQSFILARRDVPPGKTYRMHWHDFLEFEIIVSGQGWHVYNNMSSLITNGCAYLMGFNDFHSLTAITDMTLYCIQFNKELLSPELADHLEFNKFHCRFTPDETHTVVQKLLQMEQEQASARPFRDTMIQNLLEDILIGLIRNSAGNTSLVTTPAIRQAVVYLNANFRKHVTMERLAKEIFLSPNYLGLLFKNELGVSVHEYLNKLRLKCACDLLTSTQLTAKEIAFASGYNSVEYFMYMFKKSMLMTPIQYRMGQNQQ